MTCQRCNTAKDFPGHQMFDPACIFCGARLIQRLILQPITPEQCRDRRKAVLADWMAHGHDEQQLRALAKGPHCTGPARVMASDPPSTTKRRSHGTK